jgi:prepilin-type N-terminal cleavage/methylation domain-containing protein
MGFTLIEVLVSITLMAAIATVVLSATRSGMSMWDKGTNHIESLRRSRVVMDVLNDQIRGALPLTYEVRADDRVSALLAFEGTGTGLRFVTRTSFKDGPDGVPRWVHIHWNHDGQSSAGDLIVEERRILPPDNVPDPTVYWRGSVLGGSICSFAFLPPTQPNKPATWLQEWHYPANSTLPKAVRLDCILNDKSTVRSVLPLDYAASSTVGLTLR